MYACEFFLQSFCRKNAHVEKTWTIGKSRFSVKVLNNTQIFFVGRGRGWKFYENSHAEKVASRADKWKGERPRARIENLLSPQCRAHAGFC